MVLDIALKDLATGQSVFARDVLSKPTLVLAVRRPGCPLCREQAAKLSVFRRDIRKCGIDMIAVFKEELGTEEFKPTFWRDAMYLDTNRDFYKLLHGGKINKASMFSLLSTNMFAVGKRASADGYTGNVTGEGFVLGGLLILDKQGAPVYQYAESKFGDHAPLEQVLEACKQLAPPEVQSQMNPEQMVKDAQEKGLFKKDQACSAEMCAL